MLIHTEYGSFDGEDIIGITRISDGVEIIYENKNSVPLHGAGTEKIQTLIDQYQEEKQEQILKMYEEIGQYNTGTR